MKRSKMITHLENQMVQECMFGDYKEPDGCWDSRKVAELILDRLEREGMRPPPYSIPFPAEIKKYKGLEKLEEYCVGYVWEPEDE